MNPHLSSKIISADSSLLQVFYNSFSSFLGEKLEADIDNTFLPSSLTKLLFFDWLWSCLWTWWPWLLAPRHKMLSSWWNMIPGVLCMFQRGLIFQLTLSPWPTEQKKIRFKFRNQEQWYWYLTTLLCKFKSSNLIPHILFVLKVWI